MAREVKVLIADDHPVFRRGLRQVIEANAKFTVLHEAADGEQALQLLEKQEADVAVIDIKMPGLDGFEVVRSLQRRNSRVEVLFLTMYNEEDMFNEAMALGVKGYVLKDSAAMDILNGIEAIAEGRHFVSAGLSEFLFARSSRAPSHPAAETKGLETLTPSERRILKMISENQTSKEIAGTLGLSVRTVDNHRANICGKLDLHGVHSLVKFAFDHKTAL